MSKQLLVTAVLWCGVGGLAVGEGTPVCLMSPVDGSYSAVDFENPDARGALLPEELTVQNAALENVVLSLEQGQWQVRFGLMEVDQYGNKKTGEARSYLWSSDLLVFGAIKNKKFVAEGSFQVALAAPEPAVASQTSSNNNVDRVAKKKERDTRSPSNGLWGRNFAVHSSKVSPSSRDAILVAFESSDEQEPVRIRIPDGVNEITRNIDGVEVIIGINKGEFNAPTMQNLNENGYLVVDANGYIYAGQEIDIRGTTTDGLDVAGKFFVENPLGLFAIGGALAFHWFEGVELTGDFLREIVFENSGEARAYGISFQNANDFLDANGIQFGEAQRIGGLFEFLEIGGLDGDKFSKELPQTVAIYQNGMKAGRLYVTMSEYNVAVLNGEIFVEDSRSLIDIFDIIGNAELENKYLVGDIAAIAQVIKDRPRIPADFIFDDSNRLVFRSLATRGDQSLGEISFPAFGASDIPPALADFTPQQRSDSEFFPIGKGLILEYTRTPTDTEQEGVIQITGIEGLHGDKADTLLAVLNQDLADARVTDIKRVDVQGLEPFLQRWDRPGARIVAGGPDAGPEAPAADETYVALAGQPPAVFPETASYDTRAGPGQSEEPDIFSQALGQAPLTAALFTVVTTQTPQVRTADIRELSIAVHGQDADVIPTSQVENQGIESLDSLSVSSDGEQIYIETRGKTRVFPTELLTKDDLQDLDRLETLRAGANIRGRFAIVRNGEVFSLIPGQLVTNQAGVQVGFLVEGKGLIAGPGEIPRDLNFSAEATAHNILSAWEYPMGENGGHAFVGIVVTSKLMEYWSDFTQDLRQISGKILSEMAPLAINDNNQIVQSMPQNGVIYRDNGQVGSYLSTLDGDDLVVFGDDIFVANQSDRKLINIIDVMRSPELKAKYAKGDLVGIIARLEENPRETAKFVFENNKLVFQSQATAFLPSQAI